VHAASDPSDSICSVSCLNAVGATMGGASLPLGRIPLCLSADGGYAVVTDGVVVCIVDLEVVTHVSQPLEEGGAILPEEPWTPVGPLDRSSALSLPSPMSCGVYAWHVDTLPTAVDRELLL
ncbi:hypothetical protein KIPB_015893, partial [Kipferlia bialata]